MEELKAQDSTKSTLQYFNNSAYLEKVQKKKKKDQCKRDRDRQQESSTLISEVSVIKLGESGKKKNKNRKCSNKDLKMVIYFNYDKKSYYANNCSEPLKNYYWSW